MNVDTSDFEHMYRAPSRKATSRWISAAAPLRDRVVRRDLAKVHAEVLADLAQQVEALDELAQAEGHPAGTVHPLGKPKVKQRGDMDAGVFLEAKVEVPIPGR